jgi:hypothetical protein
MSSAPDGAELDSIDNRATTTKIITPILGPRTRAHDAHLGRVERRVMSAIGGSVKLRRYGQG